MDLMKVFDQAVREIKREVNLKVLKVSEIEQKVLDATDDEPWGPHGTVLAEIAQATKNFSEYQMVMNVLWKRLTETSKNWRLVYKALAVIEYLVAHGSEDVVDDIIEHTYQISSLSRFEYVEPSGKDLGINVRKRAETISALLNDPDKVQEVRSNATANLDKYVGLSSSGVTHNSRAASFSSSNLRSGDPYRGLGHAGDSDTFMSNYKYWDQYQEDKDEWTNKSTEEPLFYNSNERESAVNSALRASRETNNSDGYASLPSQNIPSDKYDENFDDFDPRGTSTSKSSTESNQVDLFEGNFVDLLDGPVSHQTHDSTSLKRDTSEVDLFADANFISATPEPKVLESDFPQTDVDLFASQPVPFLSTTMGFLAASNPISLPENKASKSITTSGTVDPFAAIPLNNFDGSDAFGAFSSHTDPFLTNNSSPGGGCPGNSRESPVETKIHGNMNAPSVETKKQTFRVSSAIWADSISQGLIDLNISARGSTQNGSRMSKSEISLSTSTSNDFFPSLSSQQYQFGGFQK